MDLRHDRPEARTNVCYRGELGTVSKAALNLGIAQPALSRHISDLEAELGLKLFDRVGRRLLLTGEGEQLLSDCRGSLNCAAGVGERAQEIAAELTLHQVQRLSDRLPRGREFGTVAPFSMTGPTIGVTI
jgi:DNA-binding transcriptional LysR family regulator